MFFQFLGNYWNEPSWHESWCTDVWQRSPFRSMRWPSKLLRPVGYPDTFKYPLQQCKTSTGSYDVVADASMDNSGSWFGRGKSWASPIPATLMFRLELRGWTSKNQKLGTLQGNHIEAGLNFNDLLTTSHQAKDSSICASLS